MIEKLEMERERAKNEKAMCQRILYRNSDRFRKEKGEKTKEGLLVKE